MTVRKIPNNSGDEGGPNFGGGGGTSGANTALSNLASTDINADLIPALGSFLFIGSDTNPFGNIITKGGLIVWDGSAPNSEGGFYTWEPHKGPSFGDGYDTNHNVIVDMSALTAPRTIAVQDKDGIIAMTSDIPSIAALANKTLSNLTATAINSNLTPAVDGSRDLGDDTHKWNGIYCNLIHYAGRPLFKNFGTGFILGFNDDAFTADRTLTVRDTSGTIALLSDIPAAGANDTLSNLGATAVNADIIPATNASTALGTEVKAWEVLCIDNGGAIFFSQGLAGMSDALGWTSGTGPRWQIHGSNPVTFDFAGATTRSFKFPDASGDTVVTVQGIAGAATVILGVPAHVATGGGDTLPANPVGFIRLVLNGTEIRVPYYGT